MACADDWIINYEKMFGNLTIFLIPWTALSQYMVASINCPISEVVPFQNHTMLFNKKKYVLGTA
jgi:hypothetical protein